MKHRDFYLFSYHWLFSPLKGWLYRRHTVNTVHKTKQINCSFLLYVNRTVPIRGICYCSKYLSHIKSKKRIADARFLATWYNYNINESLCKYKLMISMWNSRCGFLIDLVSSFTSCRGRAHRYASLIICLHIMIDILNDFSFHSFYTRTDSHKLLFKLLYSNTEIG